MGQAIKLCRIPVFCTKTGRKNWGSIGKLADSSFENHTIYDIIGIRIHTGGNEMMINGLVIAKIIHQRTGWQYDAIHISENSEIFQVKRLNEHEVLSADTLYIGTMSMITRMKGKLSGIQLLCVADAELPIWCEYQRDITLLSFSQTGTEIELYTLASSIFIEMLKEKMEDANFYQECCNVHTLDKLVAIALKYFHVPMIIADHNGRIITMSKEVDTANKLWHHIQATGETQNLHLYQATSELSRVGNTAMYYQAIHQWDVQYGTVIVLCEHSLPDAKMRQRLNTLCIFVGNIMSQNIARPLSEKQRFDEFMMSLISGRNYPEKVIKERTEAFCDFRKRDYHICVIAFGSKDPEADYRKLKVQLQLRQDEMLYFYHHIGVLITRRPPVRNFIPENNLLELLRKNGWHVGTGQPVVTGQDIRTSFLQADRALYFGNLLDEEITSYLYDDYVPYHILDSCAQNIDLFQYCIQPVRRLYEYDIQNGGDLLKTLDVFLLQNQNTAATANKLFVHRNTVSYRISKCKEIMGIDFETAGELFNVELSIRIIRYMKSVSGVKAKHTE